MTEQVLKRVDKCPVMGATHASTSPAVMANQKWWPEQLNLKSLQQNSPLADPMDKGFNYAKESALQILHTPHECLLCGVNLAAEIP